MDAMVLSAGLGTRLKPITNHVAKAAIPVLGEPNMRRILFWLQSAGVTRAVVNLHHLSQTIKTALLENPLSGISVQCSYEDNMLGTAGGLKHASKFIKSDPFLMVNADIVVDMDLTQALELHLMHQAIATMILKPPSTESNLPKVGLDQEGKIAKFKSFNNGIVSKWGIFTGIHIFNPHVLNFIPPGLPYEINEKVYPELLRAGLPVYGYFGEGYWRDIGTFKDYLQLHIDAFDGILIFPFGGKMSRESIVIHPNISINRYAKLFNPCYIGELSTIAESAVVGPYTWIGKRCLIEGSVINSIVFDDSHVEKGVIIRNAIQHFDNHIISVN